MRISNTNHNYSSNASFPESAGPVHWCSLHPYYSPPLAGSFRYFNYFTAFNVGNEGSFANLALFFMISFKKFSKFYSLNDLFNLP